MLEQDVRDILSRVGAVITDGHFVYTSGKHGSAYVNKDAIYPHTGCISLLCKEIAWQFEFDDVEVVIAPAIGGVILSQWIACHLSEMCDRDVLSVYAEKTPDGEGFVIKRGYDKLLKGKRVLVVEDVLTTGGSVKKVIEAVRDIGGEVIGLGVLCNRGGVTLADIANPPKFFSLINVDFDSCDEAECPMCAQGVPINTDVGKGREFFAKKRVCEFLVKGSLSKKSV